MLRKESACLITGAFDWQPFLQVMMYFVADCKDLCQVRLYAASRATHAHDKCPMRALTAKMCWTRYRCCIV